MRRILLGCFCLPVGSIVGFVSGQEAAPRYQPSPQPQQPALMIRGHATPFEQAAVAPQSPAPSVTQRDVVELLRGAADLLDAAGETHDASRLRDKATVFDDRRRLEEKAIELSALAQEIEQLQRRLAEKRLQHDALDKEIAKLQTPSAGPQQVLVRTKVMELSLTKLRDADFQFEGIDTQELIKSGFGSVISAISSGLPELPASPHPRSGTVVAGDKEPVAYGIFDEGNRVEALIEALRKTGALKILAEPDLVTVSGRPASFNVGGEFPVATPVGIVFRKFGTQLDLVPLVLDDERIRLEIRSRISELVEIDGERVPGLRVREVNTGFEAESGQSLVLAGLVQERVVDEKAHSKTRAEQAAGDVSNTEGSGKEQSTERVELIVVVTPHLIDAATPVRWAEKQPAAAPILKASRE